MAHRINRPPNLEIRVSQIDCTSWGPDADPDWKYVDAAGHGHFRTKAGYPTLKEITEPFTDPDDGETWDRHIRWECPHCGEHIVPGTLLAQVSRSFPGQRHYLIDGKEVDRDVFTQAWRPYATARLQEEEAAL